LADGRLVLEGHWRYPLTSDTGLVRLFVGPERTALALCRGEAPPKDEKLVLRGATGEEDDSPTEPLELGFDRPLADLRGRFFVVGHRGACRTIDDCGASENSVESIRFAPSMAADVVELDVQVSADGVPFLYHDDAFGPRLTRGAFCHGDVSAFTMAHIRELCTLRYGEAVPTLDEALEAALATPEIEAVWLDVKRPEAIRPAADAVRRIVQKRQESRRSFRVVLGLGDETLMDRYAVDVPARDVACLAELDPADVRRLGCMVWGPRWTRGPMRPDVAALQAEGKQVAFWTIDEPEYIGVFLDKALPNAIVTNRHGLVFLLAQRRAASLATLEPIRP
jgi:glycerophosphoryl diester phosphodiesterase